MSSETKGVRDHYDAVAGEYHRQYQRENLERLEKYPANYFRLQILTTRLAELGARRVYEVGVGEGTPLTTIARMGVDVAGCDISQAMVDTAQARFAEAGLDPELISWGDVEDSVTIAHSRRDGPFDAVIAAGVLPHVSNELLMLENVRMLLRDGGTALIEFRNKLFSLFTLNSKTKEFVLDDLLAGVDPQVKAVVEQDLDARLALDQPRRRDMTADGAGPGYDAILSKFHNPFEVLELFRRAGFSGARIHWYHFHPAPPMLEPQIGEGFRKAAFALEHDPSDWRGMFLCSAGVVEATKE
jgi:2-polyprenyl-3-methyl-5-hydroxy-6-metoxy-1,4-benzoquinol methylase